MAKMAYFNGSSFLSSVSDIFSTIGRGKWEIRFKIKPFTAVSGIFGVEGDYSESPRYEPLVLMGGLTGQTGRIANKLLDGSYPDIRETVIPDNTVRYIKIKGEVGGVGRILYSSIDGDEFVEYDQEQDGDDQVAPDWSLYSGLITSGGKWSLGLGFPDSLQPTMNFIGLISEFELLDNDGNQLVYLPLTEDFLDHSGNEVPVTNNGVVLVEDAMLPLFYQSTSLQRYSLINIADVWNFDVWGALFVGEGDLNGEIHITKAGMGIVTTFLPPIPKGIQVTNAAISLITHEEAYFPLNPNSKITGYKGLIPSTFDLQTYQDARGTVVGGADDSYLTSAYETYDNKENPPNTKVFIPATSPVQEIVNSSDVSKMLLFYDDHDGRSPEGGLQVYADSMNNAGFLAVVNGHLSSGLATKVKVGEDLALVPSPYIISGDVSFNEGMTEVGTCLYFPDISVEAGKQYSSARLLLKAVDLGGGYGLGGESASITIRAEKDNSPDEITDVSDYMSRARTTASVPILGQTYLAGQPFDLDVTDVLNEVLALGAVDGIHIYLEDNGSGENSCYAFGYGAISGVLEGDEPLSYSVTYNGNGGTGTLIDENSPYDEDDTVTVLANTFTREGYTFLKWNTKADGSGTDYAPADMFTISADTTLYAQWGAGTGTIAGNQSFMHYFRHMGRSCR